MKRLLLLTLLLPASVCFGQQGGIAAADTNKDGKINAAEMKTYVSSKLPNFERFDALFKAIDKNGDGSLNATEFAGRMQAIQTVQNMPAEEKKPEPKAKQEPVEFVDRFESRVKGKNPKLGSTISSELAAYDSDGKPFSFAKTRGKHTVIVFGCLT